jgi:uncharacterized protein YegP (UPF0339 family)
MKTAKFEVYQADDGWRWRLQAANARIVASGEGFTRKRDAVRACEAVAKAVLQGGAGSIAGLMKPVH